MCEEEELIHDVLNELLRPVPDEVPEAREDVWDPVDDDDDWGD